MNPYRCSSSVVVEKNLLLAINIENGTTHPCNSSIFKLVLLDNLLLIISYYYCLMVVGGSIHPARLCLLSIAVGHGCGGNSVLPVAWSGCRRSCL